MATRTSSGCDRRHDDMMKLYELGRKELVSLEGRFIFGSYSVVVGAILAGGVAILGEPSAGQMVQSLRAASPLAIGCVVVLAWSIGFGAGLLLTVTLVETVRLGVTNLILEDELGLADVGPEHMMLPERRECDWLVQRTSGLFLPSLEKLDRCHVNAPLILVVATSASVVAGLTVSGIAGYASDNVLLGGIAGAVGLIASLGLQIAVARTVPVAKFAELGGRPNSPAMRNGE